MTGPYTDVAVWLIQAARETTYVKAVGSEPGWFEQVSAIASALMTLSLLALSVFLIPAAWNFRKSYKKANALLDRVYADISPIMRHASSISDNIDYVTTTIRGDVQRINATVSSANQRIHEAVEVTEERLNEMNALLKLAQEEAEQLFVSTAATIRGVRTGAAALHREFGPELASDEDTAGDLEMAEGLDDLEDSDGDDYLVDRVGRPPERGERQSQSIPHGHAGSSGEQQPRPPAPRVRPRRDGGARHR